MSVQASRLRLLYVITNCDLGGAQSHLLDLVDGFQNEYEVLVAYGERGPMLQSLSKRGIRAIHIPSLVRNIHPLRELAALRQFGRILRDIQPNLVHAHSSKAGLIARLACWTHGIPVVYSAHGWGFGKGVPSARRIAMWVSESICMPISSAIITTCTDDQRIANRALPFSRNRTRLIFNGIPDRARLTKVQSDIPVITMIARFSEQKDHATLLKAFKPLRERARLLLVGSGPDFQSCHDFARQNDLAEGVDFAGERSDIDQILQRTDILTLITHYEGLPISILLGMRDALAIVATRVGGISDQIDNGVSGLLVDRQDPASLEEALGRLVDSPQLRHQLGEGARKKFETRFSYEWMIEQTGKVYSAIAKPRHTTLSPHDEI